MNSKVYLVVEPMAVIAQDLALNVQDYDPSATVLVAPSPDAGRVMVDGKPSVRLAFVHSDPVSFATTELAKILSQFGAQVVFTDKVPKTVNNDVFVLDRPFSAQTTAALLHRIDSAQCA